MKNNLLKNDIGCLADFIIDKVFESLNCVKIGKIINFYTDDKTADVEIVNKIKVNGELKSVALLLKCLVVGNKITTPVEQGENVVVLFNDYDINSFFETGEAQAPYSVRKHDLSDGIVICGLNSLINKINYDNENITLTYKSNLKVGETIQLNTATTEASGDVNVKGNVEGATFSTGGEAGFSGEFQDTGTGASNLKLIIKNGLIVGIQ